MSVVHPTLLAVVTGVLIYWYLDTPLPEDMQQKWKVRLIDATMRTYGHSAGVMSTLGIMAPLSDFDRRMADVFVISMTTGRPWVTRDDPALLIRDVYTEKNHIQMRMYEPKTTLHYDKRPVLVYLHGGGFSMLSIESYDAFTRHIARTSGIVVVSVNYRLSPQFPYPIPQDDCLEAIQHITYHATSLRIDTNRIAVGGDSAGGNLAASVSLRLKNKIKLQLLLVPVLQFMTYNTTSVRETKQYFSKTINSLGLISSWTNYIGCCSEYLPDMVNDLHTPAEIKRSMYADYVSQDKWMNKELIITEELKGDLTQRIDFGRDDISQKFIDKMTDPYICPLMADPELLRDLPRAYVMTAGYDIIRDEGIMYAARLKHAGVPTHFVNYPTSFHNALTFVDGPLQLDIGVKTARAIVDFLITYL